MKIGDTIALVICAILICAFVYILPVITDTVRNSASNQEIEKEQIPIKYYCERTVDNDLNAIVKQKATYTLEKQDLTYALIIRTYVFKNNADYLNYKEEKQKDNSKNQGISIEFAFNDKTKTVTETIKKDIRLIPEKEMEPNFPLTYKNLLIYTKGQKCTPTYAEE